MAYGSGQGDGYFLLSKTSKSAPRTQNTLDLSSPKLFGQEWQTCALMLHKFPKNGGPREKPTLVEHLLCILPFPPHSPHCSHRKV